MNPLKHLWLKIREPREQRFVLMGIYALALIGGLAAMLYPPQSLTGTWNLAVTYIWAFWLIAGGACAFRAVNPGWYWLERMGLICLMTGAGMYASVVGYFAVTSDGNRVTQLTFILIAFSVFIYRYRAIRGFRYEPRG